MSRRIVVSVLAVASLAAVTGCHRAKDYEATVDLEHVRVVRKDESGKPITIDIELSYRECPGDQDQVVRGGAEFAQCITSKYKIGDKVRIKIHHRWEDKTNEYTWDVTDIGGCKYVKDNRDEAGFTMIRECEDWTVNGAKVGFQCNIAPKKTLIKACPWFAKH